MADRTDPIAAAGTGVPSGPMTSPTRMAAEIAEQPEAVARTLDAVRPLRRELRALAGEPGPVLFYARGSSANAATYGSYLLEVHAGRPAALGAPSVATHYHSPLDLTGVLVVAISQSGETDDIVEAAGWARARSARVIGVTNAEGSALSGVADMTLVTRAGPERAVPATKTYTTQLAAMAGLGWALGPDDAAFEGALSRVPEAIATMLESGAEAASLASHLGQVQRLVVSGRGLVLGSAQELALKLQETCYIAALGLSSAVLQHGPIAVIDPATPALLMAARDGPMLAGMVELARAVVARGGTPLGIGGDTHFRSACAASVPGPDLPEVLSPLALIVPGQVLTEALARQRGLNPDQPRLLAKVTQTNG